MKEYKIGRNKLMDIIIAVPMLFIFIGGAYLIISEGLRRCSPVIILFFVVSVLVLAYIIYKWVRNKPFIIFNQQGIYLDSIKRNIAWDKVANLKVEEDDGYMWQSSPGTGLSSIKYYFVVFEITEVRADGRYGHDRKIRTNDTSHSADEILKIAKEFYQRYKVDK